MRRAILPASLLLLAGLVLGATVLHERVAAAAAAVQQVSVVSPVDAQGNVRVRQQGVVRTQAATPARSFSQTTREFRDGCGDNLPAGSRWVISSFAATNTSDGASGAELSLFDPGPGETLPDLQIRVPAGQTTQLTFPQPYVFTSPEEGLCLLAHGPPEVLKTVVGYRE
jgi:hypothetical protein